VEESNKRLYEAASRITAALADGLRGVVLERGHESSLVMDELLRKSGLTRVIKKWAHENIVVYYINVNMLRDYCLYRECGGKPIHEKDVCLRECINSRYAELVKAIKNTLKETASNANGL